MENNSNSIEWHQNKDLINELIQGKELAKQLQVHLNLPTSSFETRDSLLQKILNSFENALSKIRYNADPQFNGTVLTGMTESPRSLIGSPPSEDSDRDFKDPERKDPSKKRKGMPRWTTQVHISPGTGLEGALDDGYSWRKYGQKDILGAKFPRGYYRCTHRNVQNCLATKHVQRSDEDPTLYQITYRGKHTCMAQAILPEKQAPNTGADDLQPQITPYQHQTQPEVLLNFKTGLKVITDDPENKPPSFSPFCFPSTSSIKPENFTSVAQVTETSFAGNFPTSFLSPTTSGSDYFPLSPTQFNGFEANLNMETDITGMYSATTSGTNSPTVGVEFPFGHVDYYPNFTFDNPGLFF